MAYRIAYETEEPKRQRRPRVENGAHLAFIRSLPCAICGRKPCDAAHLRAPNRMLGKTEAGTAAKPDDRWATPLCSGPDGHHAEQHRGSELAFWFRYGIQNPWQLCLALFAVSGDQQEAETILSRHSAMNCKG